MKKLLKRINLYRLALFGMLSIMLWGLSVTPVIAQPAAYLAGADRYETAAKIAEAGWPTTSDVAILSAGGDANLVDALTAAPLAASKNAPILLTQGDQLNTWAEQELKRLQVSTVYITSGRGVITESVLNQLQQLGLQTIVLGGKDRFETAVNIAQQLKPFHKMVVATAWSNADALSVASIAAAQGMPILLTDTNAVPNIVSDYIHTLKDQIDQTYVLGQEGAIRNTVEFALPHPQRIGGADRYQTNLAVLENFKDTLKYQKYYLAGGEDAHLVDALTGSALASQTASAIVLTAQEIPQTTFNYIRTHLPLQVQALGGEGGVPASQLAQITATQQLNEEGMQSGSSDVNNLTLLDQSVWITSNNVHLQNAEIKGSIFVNGNNATLTHIQVDGTVFLDPGAQGAASLDNVQAGAVVVLSGAQNSIHLTHVIAQTLQIQSSSPVHVVAEAGTTLAATIIQSAVSLEANSANLGPVTLNPDSINQIISLKGNFEVITIDQQTQLKLGPDTVVQQLNARAAADLSLEGTAKIKAWSKKGHEIRLRGEGAQNVPAQESQTPVPPIVGGAGPSGSTVNVMTDIISGMTLDLKTGTGAKAIPFVLNGTTATVDLGSSGVSNEDVVMTITVTAKRNAQIVFDGNPISLNEGQNQSPIRAYGVPDFGDPGVHVWKIKEFFLGENEVSKAGSLTDTASQKLFPFILKITLP